MLSPLNRQSIPPHVTYPERLVQFGEGNFLRAFIDWIVEHLNEQTGFASSVVIVAPIPGDGYKRINEQQGLYHVQLHGLLEGELVTQRKLITCVNRAISPYDDYRAFLAIAEQPEIRFIVSNTTEAGIAFVPDDRLQDTPPSSFPGKLTAFLYHRYQHFSGDMDKGCIILPCELIDRNGDQLKACVHQYADLWQLEPGFRTWLEASHVFCNTLVDRIVPGFPHTRAEQALNELGFDDRLLVEGEQYHSWIIESPDPERVKHELPVLQSNLNIRVVDDLTPYRNLKVHILNGAHTAMVPMGHLLGVNTVREGIEHPVLGQFIMALIMDEVLPTMDFPEAELTAFAQSVFQRFQNPFIHHRLLTIALNSISKFKTRVLPSLKLYTYRQQRLPRRIVFALAALIRFYKGEWQGNPIPVNDDPAVMAWFRQSWDSVVSLPPFVTSVLQNESLWGEDLTRIDGLVELTSRYLERMETDGIARVIEQEDW